MPKRCGSGISESNGVVTEMEVQQRPPIMTMIGKTMAMIPQSALFIVHLEVDGHVGQIIMTKENYDEFSVGTAIHVTYAEQESSTKINVKGLTSA